MSAAWQIVAFPVILPWRQEFWTLPLYFPDLKVGVTPGWPPQLAYQGMPLPPEAEALPQELKYYHPGDLRQWQAFEDYRRAQGEGSDLLQAIRNYGEPPAPPPAASPPAWSLVWQLEKMQADQDVQLHLVEQGEKWLGEILRPEAWEERASFGTVPGISEMVDPELAQLRHRLWRRVMAPYFEEPWAPFLLGRTSRPLFLTLRGWPQWTGLKKVQVSLPGCRSAEEWTQICDGAERPPWQQEFGELLAALLEAAAGNQDLEAGAEDLKEFLATTVASFWPFAVAWTWDLEIWSAASAPGEEGPVLCWPGAGGGILPG